RFAAERPEMFELLFGAGLTKAEFPELQQAADGLIASVWPNVLPLTADQSEAQAWALIQAVVGLAHGYAALLLDGALEHFNPDETSCATPAQGRTHGHAKGQGHAQGAIPEPQIKAAELQAVAATRALLRGRSLLFPAAT